ncbi:hypothetical protein ICN10_01860, partial [Polynucleobacter sp. 86C-FISCH]|uniref:beta strand repeat-containing protein n=1 Tax=Polynucleobacter sp. 86C-FISCH TaxID=2689101 RepID=UPI001C0CA792
SGATADVGSYNITAASASGGTFTASNYNINYVNGSLSVTAAPLGVSATGVYNGTTVMVPDGYSVTGLMNNETITSVSALSISNANVAANTYIAGLTVGNGTANMANYQITQTYNAAPNTTTTNAFIMTPAPLTVTADNAARFIGQGLPGSYNVSYSGFVNGQNAGTSGITIGTVSNSANISSGAGPYTLTPSGFSSTNYNIGYVNGVYTVTPADTLMVQAGSHTTGYGTTASLTPASVQYYVNGTGVVSLNYVSNSGNTYTYRDNFGGNVTFTLSPANAVTSSSNNLKANSYQITGGNLTQGGTMNLVGTGVYTGSLDVTQRALTASSSNVSKVYDGTTAMIGVNISLSPVVSGDRVATSGNGAFNQANAGSNIGYNVSGLMLEGADATNYYLTGGTSFSGSNGVISQRTVTLSANQVYSGSTALTNVTIGNLVGGETLTYSGNANSKNVQDNGSNYIANMTLGNGTNGGLGSNYQLPVLNVTNAPVTITRLNSVTWTGGSTGDWFDPANWAGGAVPDLNNVANVVIPSGATVTFNNNITSPAQAGPVLIDSLGGAGGNLSQQLGTLNVGSGGITLNALTLTGGNLSSQGAVNLSTFNQLGGNVTVNSSFVTQSYSQSNGSTSVTGNLTAGNMTISNGMTTILADLVVADQLNVGGGNLTVAGDANVNAYNQTNGTASVAGNLTAGSMTLSNGSATVLANLVVSNQLNVDGGNLTVAGDANATSYNQSGGASQVSGNLLVQNYTQSNGTTSVNGSLNTQAYNQTAGNTTVQGNIDAASYAQSNGNTQAGGNLTASNVSLSGGTTQVLSNLLVNGVFSQTGGQVNVAGSGNISTSGTMTLGNLSVGGTLNANAASGNIIQSSGSRMSVTGLASFNAPLGTVSLGGNNSFAGGESIVDENSGRNDNQIKVPVDPWIFQQYAVLGGTPVYVSVPKLQISKNEKLSYTFAFNKEVELVSENLFVIPDDYVSLGVVTLEESLGAAANESPSPKQPSEVSKPQQERLKTSSPSGFMPVVFRPNKSN